jgi:hypothetical protein
MMRSGAHEIVDRGAFLQELGIADDRKIDADAPPLELRLDRRPHLVGGADGYGALVDDDLEVDHVRPDVARRGEHMLQVGRAVLVRRRAHADEQQRAMTDGGRNVGRELQATDVGVATHQRVQAGLVDRDPSFVEDLDLVGVDVDANDVIAHFCKAGAGDETNVSRANDGDLHGAWFGFISRSPVESLHGRGAADTTRS